MPSNKPYQIPSEPYAAASRSVRGSFGPYASRTNGRAYGLELEVEGVSLPGERRTNETEHWTRVNDGSLRGGYEYVNKLPVPRYELLDAIKSLDEVFEAVDRTRVIPSNRCSTHVHVNVQDLTLIELGTVLSCYYVLEPLMCRFNGVERENNLFALQARHNPSIIDTVSKMFEDGSRVLPSHFKYNALNLACLKSHSYGTLEFRSGRGINSKPSDIIPWLDLINELFDNSLRWFANPKEVIQSFSNNDTEAFIRNFFPKVYYATRHLFSSEEMKQISMSSVRFSQTLAFEINWSSGFTATASVEAPVQEAEVHPGGYPAPGPGIEVYPDDFEVAVPRAEVDTYDLETLSPADPYPATRDDREVPGGLDEAAEYWTRRLEIQRRDNRTHLVETLGQARDHFQQLSTTPSPSGMGMSINEIPGLTEGDNND